MFAPSNRRIFLGLITAATNKKTEFSQTQKTPQKHPKKNRRGSNPEKLKKGQPSRKSQNGHSIPRTTNGTSVPRTSREDSRPSPKTSNWTSVPQISNGVKIPQTHRVSGDLPVPKNIATSHAFCLRKRRKNMRKRHTQPLSPLNTLTLIIANTTPNLKNP
jgi:hypothetical protein